MIIIGAKGFAKEILNTLYWNNNIDNICFFDNVNSDIPDVLFKKFRVLKSWGELEIELKKTNKFILGIGGSKVRKALSEKVIELGGELKTLISDQSQIGAFDNTIGNGVCILANSLITTSVHVGTGSLINKSVILSHDVMVGEYCDLSPGVKLMGRCFVDNYSQIGAGAIVLPDKRVGKNCVIGAGAVVNTNIPDNSTAVGIPAKAIKIRC